MAPTQAAHVWATVQEAKRRKMVRNERMWDLEEEIWILYTGQDRAYECDIDMLKPSALYIIDNLCKELRDTGIGSKTKDWSYKPFDGLGPTNHSDFSTTQYRFILINGLSVAQRDILEHTIITPTFPHSANQLMELHGALGFDAFKDLKGESSGSALNTILTYCQSLASWMHLAYKSTMQATMADILDQLEALFKLQIIDSQKEAGSNRPVDKSYITALAKDIDSDVIICFGNQARKALGLLCQANAPFIQQTGGVCGAGADTWPGNSGLPATRGVGFDGNIELAANNSDSQYRLAHSIRYDGNAKLWRKAQAALSWIFSSDC
ncbi:hypothetical protein B0H14DRAFT_2564007 [Mycena olivaceomarginata]|nr:hypothetical protein B0H14DRAFT_2564007 [Mycena olivaceomarginata]